jgi:O-Antigen ligase
VINEPIQESTDPSGASETEDWDLEGTDRSERRLDAANLATTALMLLPAVLIVYMGFNAGGYFPGTPAVGALVLSQVLLLRLILAERPLDGFALGGFGAVAAFAAFSFVALISASWSHSTSRALLAFDRDLLYLLVLVVFVSVRPTASHLRWLIRGLALAFAILCVAGLASRVLPNVWPTAPNIINERLSYPLTYWNALGIIAGLGIVLSFHLTGATDEPWPVRVLAAALIPLEAGTLYFTFSRSSIAACFIGLIVYVLVARPRMLLSGLLAAGPTTAIAVKAAYDANLLATPHPTTSAALVQARHVALVVGVVMLVTIGLRAGFVRWLDPIDVGARSWRRIERRTRGRLAGGVVIVVVALVLALGLPGTVAHGWHQFISGAATPTQDLRARFGTVSNNGRTLLWRVAIHAFQAKPLDGQGAGTYQILWNRGQPAYEYNVNAHSLYFETLAETGLLGLVPLVLLFVGGLVALFRRCRGELRALYGALAAVAVVTAVHTGVDWDWQMPATTIAFFAAVGLALSPRLRHARGPIPGAAVRRLGALVCIVAAGLPVMIIGSQGRLHSAQVQLEAGRCRLAGRSALSAISWLPSRPEPYEILGYCDLQRGFSKLGVQAMQQAVTHDPSNWEATYALALARAASGLDPRPAAHAALGMAPHNPLAILAAETFSSVGASKWAYESSVLRTAALKSGQLSVSPG